MPRSARPGVDIVKKPWKADLPGSSPETAPGTKDEASAAEAALEERIERLEKRLEETILTGEGVPHIRSDHEPDAAAKPDPLHRAVDRANKKRT